MNTSASDGTYVDWSTQTGGGLTVATGPSTSTKFTNNVPLISVAGTASVDVDGFVQLNNVSLAVVKTVLSTIGVTDGTTPTTLTNASLLTIGISGTSGFVGINGGTASARVGETINSLALALVEPADTTDPRSWVTLQANLSNVGLVAHERLPGDDERDRLERRRQHDGLRRHVPQLRDASRRHRLNRADGSVDVGDAQRHGTERGSRGDGQPRHRRVPATDRRQHGEFQDTVLASVTVTNGTTTTTLTNAPLLTIGSAGGSGFAGFNYGTPQAIGVNLDVNSLGWR